MPRPIRLLAPLLALLVVAPVSAVGASSADWELTPAGWRSGPIIQHVKHLPSEAGAIGAVRHGRYLYVSGPRSFSIYDVRNPGDPALVSRTDLGAHALNEHPDTNGRILILANDLAAPGAPRSLGIWDVRDKAAPSQLAALPYTNTDHTWACVADCRYAYGSSGSIADLTRPSAPRLVGDWRTAVDATFTRFHGIDLVAPDRVLVASQPTVLLDTTNPVAPRALAIGHPPTPPAGLANRPSLPSYAHWPLEGAERFALETIESPFSGPCTAGSGGLVTFDTAGYETTGRLEVADVYRITQNGTFSDGRPPANAVGCSAFGLAESPDWSEGDRLVAMAAMEHGLRLLHVDGAGRITEVGGFIGHGTEAAVPVWGTRRHLYVADVGRGLDVFVVRQS